MKKFKIEGFDCHCLPYEGSDTIVYLIYPQLAELTDDFLIRMSQDHSVSLAAVYVPADKWNDALTPWPEPGEAKGFPPFAGKGEDFLNLMQTRIIPEIEKGCGITPSHRDLLGVSLSGLFTLWQWIKCDTFRSIACLSGSFWYNGFLEWFEKQVIPEKSGKAYFLLGKEEPLAHIKAYQTVGVNTEKIVEILKQKGIPVTFEWVPGNHFSRPVHRAEKALDNLYPPK